MSITIHQCLHGYSNGHQLLTSSVELPTDVKRLLLFQSDLTGSNIQTGFENYLTGYPVLNSSYYALAKTWYANEISRPGCVWTQTLLIELVDLGKIAELSSLLIHFVRPTGDFKRYELPIQFINDLSNLSNQRHDEYDILADYLYMNSQNTIIVESENSSFYEPVVFDIWSDQWPRLRRNFCFCTGVLGVKSLGAKDFDLQVVPKNISQSIARSSKNSKICNLSTIKKEKWLEVVHNTPKVVLRQFLWSYGADITGGREKFIGLISLFTKISDENIDLANINNFIKETLPSPDEGKTLKKFIFGEKVGGSWYSEFEVLYFLSTENNIEHLQIEDYNINKRLQKYIADHPEELNNVLQLLINSNPERINEDIWANIIIPENKIVEVFTGNIIKIEKIILAHPSYASLPAFWQLDNQIQSKILQALISIYPDTLPSDVLKAILKSESEIIYDTEKFYGSSVVYRSLDWLNEGNNLFPPWRNRILFECDESYITWLIENIENLHLSIIKNLFLEHHPNWVFKLPFHHKVMVTFYNLLKYEINDDKLPYISSLFLSKGLTNDDNGSQWIVSATFEDAYVFATKSMLDSHWQIIPKDLENFEEEDFSFNPFDIISKVFSITPPKKKKQIANLDYSEILIRTMTNKFIKNKWSSKCFLEVTKKPEIFYKAVEYLLSSKKGRFFLTKIMNDIQHSNLSPTQNQAKFFNSF